MPRLGLVPAGFCYNCGLPVDDGKLYCDEDCGKAFRYHMRTTKQATPRKPRQSKPSHVCFIDPRIGQCLKCRYERMRRKPARTYYVMPQAHFVHGAGDKSR